MKKNTILIIILVILLFSTSISIILFNIYTDKEQIATMENKEIKVTEEKSISVDNTNNDPLSIKIEQTQHEKKPEENKDPILSDIMKLSTRPIAVMIDNDNSDAWPHAGLEDAYIIYEIIVEGGSTRLMALFNNADTAKIGPIRSSRHYFVDYAMDHDAIYVHFGWSPQAAKYILNNNTNNVNGVYGSDEWIFWREPKHRYDYHDVYTSMKNIKKIISDKGYRTLDSNIIYKIYKSEIMLKDGMEANTISVPYSRYHKTYYEYDSKTKVYLRWMRGAEHISSTSAKQLTAKNIIIQFVKNYYIGDGQPQKDRQELENLGSGNGFFITNGKAVKITWEKPSHKQKTIYKLEDGSEIRLNEGQTWIQITPINSKVVIE